MTALELVQHIITIKFGWSDDVSALANPTLNIQKVLWAINELQRDLAKAHDWMKLKDQGEIDLATDTTTYDLAANFSRFIEGDNALYYTKVFTGDTANQDENKVTVVTDQTFKAHNPSGVTEGKPYVARLFGSNDTTFVSQLEVYGAPTLAFNGTKLYYEYQKKTVDLAADADLSVFEDETLIEGGYLKIKESDGEASQSDLIDFINSAVNDVFNNDSGRKRTTTYKDI